MGSSAVGGEVGGRVLGSSAVGGGVSGVSPGDSDFVLGVDDGQWNTIPLSFCGAAHPKAKISPSSTGSFFILMVLSLEVVLFRHSI